MLKKKGEQVEIFEILNEIITRRTTTTTAFDDGFVNEARSSMYYHVVAKGCSGAFP